MNSPRISSRQISAARELLRWPQGYLAAKAGLLEGAVVWIEAGWGDFPHTLRSVEAIRAALEDAGIDFVDDEQLSVRLRRR